MGSDGCALGVSQDERQNCLWFSVTLSFYYGEKYSQVYKKGERILKKTSVKSLLRFSKGHSAMVDTYVCVYLTYMHVFVCTYMYIYKNYINISVYIYIYLIHMYIFRFS